MNRLGYSFIEASPGLRQDEIAHLIVPGRGRSADGMDLHPFSEQRALTAAAFFHDNSLAEQEGIVVPSGYKSPADRGGEPWHDYGGIEYQGKPEAYSMDDRMIGAGVPAASIRPEVQSVDTVTNFLNSRGLLPDERPVGIVAQEEHLERMLKIIAPKTLRQEYAGIVVPELPGQPDKDNFMAVFFSRLAVLGLNLDPGNPEDILRAERRVNSMWGMVVRVRGFTGRTSRGYPAS